jgi:hypothetical protein
MFDLSYLKAWFFQKKSLTAKFAEACAKVDALQKVGNNGQFRYLRILDIADALRGELFSRGILLFPDDREWWFDSWESDGKRWLEAGVQTEFTVTDGRETLTFASFGIGRDLDGHALAIAQTEALKAWLKRIGLIYGEWDDPEKEHGDIEKPLAPREVVQIANYQQRAFSAALEQCKMSKEEAEKVISARLGQAVTADLIMLLPRKKFDQALSILYGVRDQTEEWSKSVEAIRKVSQAQPVVAALDRRNHDEVIGAD